MSKEKITKLITLNEKGPNYSVEFVTDAFIEGTPSESLVRMTFYEEFAARPDLQISDLDEEGKVVEDSVKNVSFNPMPQNESLNELNSTSVKRVDKTTLIMTKESVERLKDWLNENF